MHRVLCGLAVVAVLTTSCGGPATESPAPPISNAAAGSTAPGQAARAVSLFSTIRSAGEPCASVTQTFLQGPRDGGEVWNAACSDGPTYAVVSKAGGSTEVVTCAALESATGTKCFTKF